MMPINATGGSLGQSRQSAPRRDRAMEQKSPAAGTSVARNADDICGHLAMCAMSSVFICVICGLQRRCDAPIQHPASVDCDSGSDCRAAVLTSAFNHLLKHEDHEGPRRNHKGRFSCSSQRLGKGISFRVRRGQGQYGDALWRPRESSCPLCFNTKASVVTRESPTPLFGTGFPPSPGLSPLSSSFHG